MAYSGSQLFDFLSPINTQVDPKRVTMIPLMPYLTQPAIKRFRALEMRPSDDAVNFRFFQANIVSTPDDYLDATSEKRVVADAWRTIPKQIAACGDDPAAIYALQLLLQFVKNPNLPCIIFEHKMADDISINHSLFGQYTYVPPGEASNVQRALVAVGKSKDAPPLDGSTAFYTKLVWHYKTKKIKKSTTLVRAASAFYTCATCAAPATLVCGTCERAFYCPRTACRATHWREGGHAKICDYY
jgi:hypothetical protein